MAGIQDLVLKLVTGRTQPQLYDSAAGGFGPMAWDPERPDRSVHALASMLAAERMGRAPAAMLGIGKEVAQGFFAPFQGKSPIGPEGFDMGDIRANAVGLKAANSGLADFVLRMISRR